MSVVVIVVVLAVVVVIVVGIENMSKKQKVLMKLILYKLILMHFEAYFSVVLKLLLSAKQPIKLALLEGVFILEGVSDRKETGVQGRAYGTSNFENEQEDANLSLFITRICKLV